MYHSRMTFRIRFALVAALIGLSACGKPVAAPDAPAGMSGHSEADASQTNLLYRMSGSILRDLRYTVADPAVRRKLTDDGLAFHFDLRNGHYSFPAGTSAAVSYRSVALNGAPLLLADIDGDGYQDAVAVLTIGQGARSATEIVMVTGRNRMPEHVASYSLGHAEVLSLAFKSGKVHASVKRVLPGDSGPTVKELAFEMPRTGTGTVRNER